MDEELKYAEERGVHNHPAVRNFETTKSKLGRNDENKRGSSSSSSDILFNKDVTNDVELITNDRDATVMFVKGFKFTSYYDSPSYTR